MVKRAQEGKSAKAHGPTSKGGGGPRAGETRAPLSEDRRRLDVLLRAAREINADLDVETILRRLVACAIELVAAESGAAGLVVDGAMVFSEYNSAGRIVPIDYRFEPGQGVPGWVLANRMPYLTNDAAGDPQVIPDIRAKLGFHKLADVPIVTRGGELIGCFEIHDTADGRPFDDRDLGLLQGLAAAAAVALENARAISARKSAEEAQRESEERYRNWVNCSPDALFLHQEGRFIFVNAAGARLLGAEDSSRLIGLPILDFVHPDYRPVVKGRLEVIQGGSPVPLIEERFVRLDGSVVDVEVAAARVELKGHPVVQVVARDITERKKTEEALSKLGDEQQAIFDSIPATIWYKDCNNRFLRVNQATCDFMGLEAREIEGHTSEEIFPEFAEQYHRDDLEVIRSGRPKRGILEQARTARGDLRWVRTDKIPYRGPSGEIEGIIAFALDVTEEKRAEAQRDLLTTAIEQAHEAVMVTDVHGGILYVNPAFEEMTQYSEAELLGKNPRILKSGEHDQAFYAGLWQTLLDGKAWSGRFTNRRKDGTRYLVHAIISPVRDGQGRLTAFVAVQRDVTEWLEMRKRLERAKNLETIGMVASGVAHEVRNPLFAISTIVAALNRDLGSDRKFDEYMGHIQDQVRRLNDLMTDLLSLGRPIDERRFTLCSLRGVLEETFGHLAKAHPNLGPRLCLEIPPEPFPLLGLPGKLSQVFLNLIQNALAFSREDGLIHLRAIADEEFVSVVVSDTGPGISQDMLPKLFEPFASRRVGGTGLGLAIVRQIVTAHGGTVEGANNDPDPGATFTVRLPLASKETDGGGEEVRK